MELKNQEELDSFFSSIDWHHAFVREMHLVSPSYYLPDEKLTVAPDSKPDVFMLICTGDPKFRHVEIILMGVEQLNVPCDSELKPTGVMEKRKIKLLFSPVHRIETISCRVIVRPLGDEVSGWDLRYGISNPFNVSGERTEQMI